MRAKYSASWLVLLLAVSFAVCELALFVLPVDGVDPKTVAKDLLKKYGPAPHEIMDPPGIEAPRFELWKKVKHQFRRLTGTVRSTPMAPHKACFANQRVIVGAIEMYNQDHPSTQKNSLSDAEVSVRSGDLVKGGYLKTPVTRPCAECRYESYGTPSVDGMIYCRYHGAADEEVAEALRDVSGYKRGAGAKVLSSLSIIASAVALVFSMGLGVWFFLKRRRVSAEGQAAG